MGEEIVLLPVVFKSINTEGKKGKTHHQGNTIEINDTDRILEIFAAISPSMICIQ